MDDLYATKPPWDIDRPQPAFAALAHEAEIRGRVLDIGCGTGEHAILAAQLGLDATGIDKSVRALEHAERKAHERRCTARFLHHNALRLTELGETFDTILDCGLFHTFAPALRPAYTRSLASALPPGGRYFMLGFSDRQPGTWGPRRLSRNGIEEAFTGAWHLDSIAEATIEIMPDPNGVAAWLTIATRR